MTVFPSFRLSVRSNLLGIASNLYTVNAIPVAFIIIYKLRIPTSVGCVFLRVRVMLRVTWYILLLGLASLGVDAT